MRESLATPRSSWALLRVLRPHQWVKNLLVMVPALAAHRFDFESVGLALLAVMAFSLCASAGYIFNDIGDRETDSQHPGKCFRPIAAGLLSVRDGIVAAMFLFAMALLLAVTILPPGFAIVLICYLLMSTAYTLLVRQLPWADILALTLFYIMRLFAGSLAVGVPLSAWLVVFAACLFLSLAILKRCAELRLAIRLGHAALIGRPAYATRYLRSLEVAGMISSSAALLVLGGYVTSDTTASSYREPLWLWGCWASLTMWMALAWVRTRADSMPDDPVLFAISDKRSLALTAMAVLFVVAAI